MTHLAPPYSRRPVRRINVAFARGALTEAMSQALADACAAALVEKFCLPRESVSVRPRPRLPDGLPFTITVYVGSSDTDSAQMVHAARVVLPLLRAAGLPLA